VRDNYQFDLSGDIDPDTFKVGKRDGSPTVSFRQT
jgi:hypothetical protein